MPYALNAVLNTLPQIAAAASPIFGSVVSYLIKTTRPESQRKTVGRD